MGIDSIIKEYIDRAVAAHLPRVVAECLKASSPPPEWMTETQLAEYWQLTNSDGEPTTAGIRSWSNRSADEHPLPYGNMGEIRRYHRETADAWAREEVAFQRARVEARRGARSGLRAVGDDS